MKGKVIKINPCGFQNALKMYKWEITIQDESGQAVYSRYYIKDSLNFSVDDEITFEANEKGTIKNINRVSGPNAEVKERLEGNNQETPFEPAINKDKQASIERQKCLDEAGKYFERFPSKKEMKIEYLLTAADIMHHWVSTGNLPKGTSEPVNVETDDLPF